MKSQIKDAADSYYFVKGDWEKAKEIIAHSNPSIIYLNSVFYESGYRHDAISLAQYFREKGIRILSGEQFVVPDEEVERAVDVRLFVSKTCLLKYRYLCDKAHRSARCSLSYLYNPIETRPLRTVRDSFVIGRIGRASTDKWDRSLVDAMPAIVKKIPNVRFVFRAFPSQWKHSVPSDVQKRCRFMPETSSLSELEDTIDQCDVMVQFSRIGETFGCAIAEAMARGIAVIVNSTDFRTKYPYDRDNAQVELVDHAKNGFVVVTQNELVHALQKLQSKTIRKNMGVTAYKKAQQFDAKKCTRQLENWFYSRVKVKEMSLQDYNKRTPQESHLTRIYAWAVHYLSRAHSKLPTRSSSDLKSSGE